MMKPRPLEIALGVMGLALMSVGIAAHVRSISGTPTARVQASQESPAAPPSRTFAIVAVRLFDGVRAVEHSTVVVTDGVITAAGPDVAVPKEIPIVDGAGKTLLPGLIDAHTHAYQDALERALVFGVTTEVDMFTDYAFAAVMRQEQKHGPVTTRADLVSAGTLVTAPGGHGTEYGMRIPTLDGPRAAQAFVDARILEGSDFIKIIYDDGAAMGYAYPTLNKETLEAVVRAAHERHKMAVVHIGTRQGARDALDAGADGLAHIFGDVVADAELVALARNRGSFVIPTLTVIASTAGTTADAKALAVDNAFAGFIGPGERRTLNASFPLKGTSKVHLDAALKTTGLLHEAGVPLLAGTDAPNPGTAHGISLHQELANLVRSGLSPSEALAAATSVPARIFGLGDRGRIAPGRRADLVLVDGDPTRDITATRRIAAIWKAGQAFARPAAPATGNRPVRIETDGRVSSFDTGMQVGFGAGWAISTDKMMGGSSEASMHIVPDGAEGSKGSLEITGSVKPGSPYPWAGAMFFPGPQPMAPADLSRFKDLVFWARGDGGTFRVMVFAERLGYIPVEQAFTAGPVWRETVLPLASFGNLDGSDLEGVLFSASAGQNSFRLQIDGVRFR